MACLRVPVIVGDGLTDPNNPSHLGQASLMHKEVASDGSVHYYPKRRRTCSRCSLG